MRLKEIFQLQKRPGDIITVGDLIVTPLSQSFIIRCPYGGWVWNRPRAVVVERDGNTERIPIIDITRIVQLGLFGLSLTLFIFTIIRRRRNRNDN